MRIQFLITFIFSFFFTSINLVAQSYSFTSYSIADGLAQTQVKAITEDKNGYLWIGTLGGLSSFNGSTFKNYSTNDGLLNNRITALFSNNDELWIGHQGGVSLYKGRKFTSWYFGNQNQNISVSKLIYFQDKLVISTNGNGLYVLEKNKLRHIQLSTEDENRIRGIEIKNKELLLATRAGLYVTSNLSSFFKINDPYELNLTGIFKKEQAIFVTNTDGQIFQYIESQKKFKTKLNINQEVYLNSCFVDSKWNIWSTCLNGLIYKSPQRKFQIINENHGLPFNSLNCVYEDKNGTIWIGTDGKGLLRFGGTNFVYFNEKSGIQSNLITSSLEFYKNSFYFGSYDNGLIEYKNNLFKHYSFEKARIWASVLDLEHNLWIGTDNGLLKTNLFKTIKFNEESGSPGQKVTCFFKENETKIYVGGSGGISIISNGTIKNISKNFDVTTVGTIRNITRYKNKLICASDGGLFLLKNGQFTRFLAQENTCYSLKVDENENLWIGGEDGLFCSDGKILKKVFLSNQPASNFINFIDYSKGHIYVGTNNGLYELSSLHFKEKAKIVHYGLEDGLVNLETNINSSLIDSQGNLWFGTSEGLVCFYIKSKSVISSDNKPFLNVLNLKVNFQDIKYSDYSSNLNAEGLPLDLILSPTKNNLLLELDGVLLKNFKDLKYEYWLEGLNETWVPSFSSPLISLSNLPSGKYILHVRAKNGQNVYSDEYKLQLTVKPIFYKTWWFITLATLFISFTVYLYIKSRINREKEERYKESLEYKSKLISLEQQSLNASMNRHFIFNSLNSIQYFINTQDKLSANKYLTNFAKLIRKNLDSATENNNQIDLNQEIERLDLYLSLESMRFKDRFDYIIDTGDIDLESIQVPAMLFQPFVENSIIHGILPNTEKKGLISIKLIIENDTNGKEKLVVCIEDNGVGIEKSMSKKGNIDGDHKSQGMEITAKRINLLNKLSRQDFELEGPFQLEDENGLINGTRVLIKIPL